MTPLMIVGVVLSALGVAIALGVFAYYISLPMNDPVHIFFDTVDMGLPYLVYFVILGTAVSALGLMVYMKAVRTGITVSASPRYAPSPIVARRPPPPRPSPRFQRPAAPPPARGANVVEEIEKEIEEIISSEEPPTLAEAEKVPPPEAAPPAERRLVEVVSKASDMVCPHCGVLNPLGSTKCQGCGRQLFTPDSPSRSCPVCGAPLTLSQRISGDLFVCGICFSELRVHPALQKSLKLR